MEIQYNFVDKIVYAEILGDLDYESVSDGLKQLKHFAQTETFFAFLDLSKTEAISLTLTDIEGIVGYVKDIVEKSDLHLLAIYAPDSVAYMMSKLFRTTAREEGIKTEITIFRSEDYAEEIFELMQEAVKTATN